MVMDVGETAREVKSKREFGGNEGGTQGGDSVGGNTVTGGTQGGGSGGGNTMTRVLIGGSGTTVRRHEEADADAAVVVWCVLSKEEGGMVGGGEGRDGEVEDHGIEMVWA